MTHKNGTEYQKGNDNLVEVSMHGQSDMGRGRVFRRSLSILSLGVTFALVGLAPGQCPLAQLKVISVRKMTDAGHAKRLWDDVATRYIVRFRLEVSGDEGLYVLLSGPKGTPPLGYALERRSNSIAWRDGSSSQVQVKSPGVEKLAKQLGASWVLLPAAAVYEWEVDTEASKSSIDESKSVFIRRDMNSRPTELISSWYTAGDKVGNRY